MGKIPKKTNMTNNGEFQPFGQGLSEKKNHPFLSFFVSLKYNQGLNLRTSTLWNKQEALITEPLQSKESALFP